MNNANFWKILNSQFQCLFSLFIFDWNWIWNAGFSVVSRRWCFLWLFEIDWISHSIVSYFYLSLFFLWLLVVEKFHFQWFLSVTHLFKILKKVAIPSSVNFIGNSAFSGCSSLVDIDIPPSVKQIGENVFDGCDLLKSVIKVK